MTDYDFGDRDIEQDEEITVTGESQLPPEDTSFCRMGWAWIPINVVGIGYIAFVTGGFGLLCRGALDSGMNCVRGFNWLGSLIVGYEFTLILGVGFLLAPLALIPFVTLLVFAFRLLRKLYLYKRR